jgi:hypothetical protein
MDVWTLGEKFKKQGKAIASLETRVKSLESYLSKLTKGNKQDEKVQDKKSTSSGVRTRGRVTNKS